MKCNIPFLLVCVQMPPSPSETEEGGGVCTQATFLPAFLTCHEKSGKS